MRPPTCLKNELLRVSIPAKSEVEPTGLICRLRMLCNARYLGSELLTRLIAKVSWSGISLVLLVFFLLQSAVTATSQVAEKPTDRPTICPTLGSDLEAGTCRITIDDVNLDGLAVSPSGHRVLMAVSAAEGGSWVVTSDGTSDFEAFRVISLPSGYRWFHPAFYPQGEQALIASLCVDATACGEAGRGWHIWRIDVGGDAEPHRLTRRRDGLMRWRPYVADGGTVYFVAVQDLGNPVRSDLIAQTAIARLSPDGTETAVFPVDAFDRQSGLDEFEVFARGVGFTSLQIVFASAERLVLGGKASNFYTAEIFDKHQRGRTLPWNYVPQDPRLLALSSWMRQEKRNSTAVLEAAYVNRTPNTLFIVDDDSSMQFDRLYAGLSAVTVELPKGGINLNTFAASTTPDAFVLEAPDLRLLRNKIWRYSDGRLELLFDPPGENGNATHLAASANANLVLLSRTTSIDRNLQPSGASNAPVVIFSSSGPIRELSELVIEGM